MVIDITKLYVYTLNPETGEYTKSSNEYSFVAPYGDGSYVFADTANNLVTVQYYQGDVLLRTAAAGATQFKFDLCMQVNKFVLKKNFIKYTWTKMTL